MYSDVGALVNQIGFNLIDLGDQDQMMELSGLDEFIMACLKNVVSHDEIGDLVSLYGFEKFSDC